MSALSFLNPVYLGALGLAALPILIHLIRRRRVRVIPWAAWEFLLQSTRRNRRRLRLEQLILLLLRILIVCLVVLAFCRPLFRSLGLPLVAADARVHVVIVLDNSYSMGYGRAGMTDFDRARRVADNLLARVLKAGDSVSIVLLSSKPSALLRDPTFDLRKAREQVRTAKLSDRETDFGASAILCANLLKAVRTPTKEVYWITDGQKVGFGEQGHARALAAWKEIGSQARVTWIDVSSPNRENLSLDTPTFSRELVTPQAPVRIEATVHNHTGVAKKGLLINLTVDNRPSGSARVDVPAHGQVPVSFVYLFEKAGVHTGTLQISQPDSLGRDNTAYFAARVRESLRALIINPRPGVDPAKDEAFYLSTALSPTGASEGAQSTIQTTVRSGSSLAGVNLRAFDAVIITGLSDVSPTDRNALQDFVNNGGGLLLFPALTADPARLQAINAAWGSGERFLPSRLGTRRVLSEENAASLNPATITHPALAPFHNTEEINLGSARFNTLYDLVPAPNDPAVQILCRFNGGQPALLERKFGQGKVILGAMSAGAGGGNLPYKPAFVPLVHQLVAYLAAGPNAQHNLFVDDPFFARFDVTQAGKPIRLTDPAGQTILRKSTLGAEGVVFNYTNTDQAGFYRVEVGTGPTIQNQKSKIENRDAFAINLSGREADLAAADERQIQAAVGPVRMQFAKEGDDLLSLVGKARRGTEVWKTLIFMALICLFLEGLLAQRFGHRGEK